MEVANRHAKSPEELAGPHAHELVVLVDWDLGTASNRVVVHVLNVRVARAVEQPPPQFADSFLVNNLLKLAINAHLKHTKYLTQHDQLEGEEEYERFQVQDHLPKQYDDWREFWKDPQEEKGFECQQHDDSYYVRFAPDVLWPLEELK